MIRLIEQVAYEHSTWQMFSDFLEMSAITISNCADPVQRDVREQRYMEIIQQYKPKEQALFPQMLNELINAMQSYAEEKRLVDVLGRVFHELELHNKYHGQFFTPQPVADMMGMMCAPGGKEQLAEKGYHSVLEPCIGSGVMVMGLANSLALNGMNYCKQLVVTGVDIDLKCVHMAYLQLALYGIPAVIIHGNTLTCEEWSCWYTPVYILDGWLFRERCGITTASGWEDDEKLKLTLYPAYRVIRQMEALFEVTAEHEPPQSLEPPGAQTVEYHADKLGQLRLF